MVGAADAVEARALRLFGLLQEIVGLKPFVRECAPVLSRHPSGIPLQELEYTSPPVSRCFGELLLLPVEEAVRRTVVDDDLVLYAGPAERLVELRVVLRSDVLIVSGLQREDRAPDLGDPLTRAAPAVPLAGVAVEADAPREPVSRSGGEP